MSSIDEVLTIAEVAADLRCSKAHVANMIRGRVRGVQQLPAILAMPVDAAVEMVMRANTTRPQIRCATGCNGRACGRSWWRSQPLRTSHSHKEPTVGEYHKCSHEHVMFMFGALKNSY